jgi:uncharacterized membrane protein HdeD (DUF308 family)
MARFDSSATSYSADLNGTLAHNWWLIVLRGVIAVLFGVIALLVPAATVLALVLLFSAFMALNGIFGLIAAVRAARHGGRWGLLAFLGIVDIAAAVIAFLWPGITAVAFVLLLAAWALVSGGLQIGLAFRVDGHHGRWWLALGGVASVIFGVLLVLAPLLGVLVLTWWLGAYAIVFGVAMLISAFRLRLRHHDGTPAAHAA